MKTDMDFEKWNVKFAWLFRHFILAMVAAKISLIYPDYFRPYRNRCICACVYFFSDIWHIGTSGTKKKKRGGGGGRNWAGLV